MKLLLDTHTVLWFYWADVKLSATAAKEITDPVNQCFVSPSSYWEIAIKVASKKLSLRESFPDFIHHAVVSNGFSFLPIQPSHAAALINLPVVPSHKDPFDRMLIAQSIVEGYPVIGADTAFDSYPIIRIW